MTVEICADCADAFCDVCNPGTTCAGQGVHCTTCGPGDCGPCADAERDDYLADIAEDHRLTRECE